MIVPEQVTTGLGARFLNFDPLAIEEAIATAYRLIPKGLEEDEQVAIAATRHLLQIEIEDLQRVAGNVTAAQKGAAHDYGSTLWWQTTAFGRQYLTYLNSDPPLGFVSSN